MLDILTSYTVYVKTNDFFSIQLDCSLWHLKADFYTRGSNYYDKVPHEKISTITIVCRCFTYHSDPKKRLKDLPAMLQLCMATPKINHDRYLFCTSVGKNRGK